MPTTIEAKFPLGYIKVAAKAGKRLERNDIDQALRRHGNGDWGDVSFQEREDNDAALAEGKRIISSYKNSYGFQFWVVTQANRSGTTILIADDM